MKKNQIKAVRPGYTQGTHTIGGEQKVSNKTIIKINKSFEEQDNNDNAEFTVILTIRHNKTNTKVQMKSNHEDIIPIFNDVTFDGFRSIDINKTLSNGIVKLTDLVYDKENKKKKTCQK